MGRQALWDLILDVGSRPARWKDERFLKRLNQIKPNMLLSALWFYGGSLCVCKTKVVAKGYTAAMLLVAN